MPTLSYDDVAKICYNAGFRGDNLATAIAVARAESGFNPSNISTNSDTHKTHDRGLFQINNYWHPEITDSCAFDAQCNANSAYAISQQGTNWSQWSAYKNGSYLLYMVPAKTAASKAITGGGGTDNTGGDYNDAITAIYTSCNAEHPFDDAGYAQCVAERSAYIQQALKSGGAAQTSAECTACGWRDIPACFYCGEQYIFQIFSWAGVNLALIAVLLIGLYFLFQEEFKATANKAIEALPKVIPV